MNLNPDLVRTRCEEEWLVVGVLEERDRGVLRQLAGYRSRKEALFVVSLARKVIE